VHGESVRSAPGAAPRDTAPMFRDAAGDQRFYGPGMTFILWLLAVVLVVSGIVAIFRSQLLWGIVLIVVGLLVGPGGTSIFT
jgi:uncharacterized membrane protein YhaH (DUF805 family)